MLNLDKHKIKELIKYHKPCTTDQRIYGFIQALSDKNAEALAKYDIGWVVEFCFTKEQILRFYKYSFTKDKLHASMLFINLCHSVYNMPWEKLTWRRKLKHCLAKGLV